MARIGINALYLIPGGVGGTEIYLRELLAALAAIDRDNQYFVFINSETDAGLVPAQENFHVRRQALRARIRPARILWEQTILLVEASGCGLDVLLNAGFTAPVAAACPMVTVFHDLQHLRHPEHFRWFDLPFWRLLLWSAAHRSRRLIAVSEATRGDLMGYYGLPESRIATIPHGVAARFSALDREHIEPVLLCVSTLHPHKNLERLIRAYARRPRAARLVLAGMRGFHAGRIEALIAELTLGDSVRITGWIPREELYQIFARARAFVYPSTFEGFGMPVLEALTAGIPTACSEIPPLREVAGEAALFFDPLDEEAISVALDRVLEDEMLRAKLSGEGRERARRFSWESTARRTLDVLLEASGQPRAAASGTTP
jgi:glycosyltransferase involved in cell wall biosynthesis